jgi:dipeptidyl aminopeptidase/acylaminoacyl peptidase
VIKESASAASAAPQARRAPRQYTIDQFMAVVRVAGASFSRDEKRILFSSNQSGIKAISPLFHADKIRKPLLVLQGANDPA